MRRSRRNFGEGFYGDGYYVGIVRHEQIAEVIREYIKKYGKETRHKHYEPLRFL